VQANNNTSLKEISTRVLGQEAILCKEGNCIGTMKKRSVSKKSSHHWLPSIHEDYCGTRHHKSRHCWNIANYMAAIVKEDGCNSGLLVAANNHCLMSKFGKFGKFGSHHC
jgi:hypothetical protein